MDPNNIPEITPQELAAKQARGESFWLVDVRETAELMLANLGETVIHLPLSELVKRQLGALPPELEDKTAELILFCHHGIRSTQICAFLQAHGWQNVYNLRGGIHAYATEVDPDVGIY